MQHGDRGSPTWRPRHQAARRLGSSEGTVVEVHQARYEQTGSRSDRKRVLTDPLGRGGYDQDRLPSTATWSCITVIPADFELDQPRALDMVNGSVVVGRLAMRPRNLSPRFVAMAQQCNSTDLLRTKG